MTARGVHNPLCSQCGGKMRRYGGTRFNYECLECGERVKLIGGVVHPVRKTNAKMDMTPQEFEILNGWEPVEDER